MKLELLEVELRPRSHWEGVDLGLALLQRWAPAVLWAWLATAGAVAAVMLIALRDHLVWWAFLMWCLKPLFERVVVFVLARSMFGSTPTVLDVLRSLREIWWRGLLRTLTWRRLTTTRALLQPVELLEGVHGAERARRERDIAADARGTITLVALTSWIFERMLEGSFILLIIFVTPQELLPNFAAFQDSAFEAFGDGWFVQAICVSHFAAYTIASGLHAASGFGLYLQRRTELEGWDIEVAFRRLGERVKRSSAPRGAVAGIALALVSLFAIAVPRANGQSNTQSNTLEPQGESTLPLDPDATTTETVAPQVSDEPADEAARALARVLEHPDFETEESSRTLDFDWTPDVDSAEPLSFGFLSGLFQVLAWAAAIVVGVGLVYLIVSSALRFRREPSPERTPRTHAFGLDIRPESLPDDVAGEARALWRRGEARAALGLLYRAAIARLVSQNGLALEASDTESDCLQRARRSAPAARAAYFSAITSAWLVCAYARSLPSTEAVEALCDAWAEQFDAEVAA